jgi:hypothetical protein
MRQRLGATLRRAVRMISMLLHKTLLHETPPGRSTPSETDDPGHGNRHRLLGRSHTARPGAHSHPRDHATAARPDSTVQTHGRSNGEPPRLWHRSPRIDGGAPWTPGAVPTGHTPRLGPGCLPLGRRPPTSIAFPTRSHLPHYRTHPACGPEAIAGRPWDPIPAAAAVIIHRALRAGHNPQAHRHGPRERRAATDRRGIFVQQARTPSARTPSALVRSLSCLNVSMDRFVPTAAHRPIMTTDSNSFDHAPIIGSGTLLGGTTALYPDACTLVRALAQQVLPHYNPAWPDKQVVRETVAHLAKRFQQALIDGRPEEELASVSADQWEVLRASKDRRGPARTWNRIIPLVDGVDDLEIDGITFIERADMLIPTHVPGLTHLAGLLAAEDLTTEDEFAWTSMTGTPIPLIYPDDLDLSNQLPEDDES